MNLFHYKILIIGSRFVEFFPGARKHCFPIQFHGYILLYIASLKLHLRNYMEFTPS